MAKGQCPSSSTRHLDDNSHNARVKKRAQEIVRESREVKAGNRQRVELIEGTEASDLPCKKKSSCDATKGVNVSIQGHLQKPTFADKTTKVFRPVEFVGSGPDEF